MMAWASSVRKRALLSQRHDVSRPKKSKGLNQATAEPADLLRPLVTAYLNSSLRRIDSRARCRIALEALSHFRLTSLSRTKQT
jgi:hypothetical protein